MHTTLEDFFASLHGEWDFTRRIQGSMQAEATGKAVFVANKTDEYAFHEEGDLHLQSGEKMNFFRSYIYRLSENYLDVLYGDGPQTGDHYQSYTFDADTQKLLPLSTHVCSADCYRGTYELIDEARFSLNTIVKGPHKDYTIDTDFVRKPRI